MPSPASSLASIDFAARNTPLQRADRLAVSLGLEPGGLWIKRDDLTGLVGGGNKARKLELLIAAAIEAGADTVVTGGAAQSNHVRATAAAARAAGLACYAVLAEDSLPVETQGNLILDDLLGTSVVWTSRSTRHDVFDETVRALREEGHSPYPIPLGGSSPLGSSAYSLCAEEITATLGAGTTTVCAVGSGGTMAGLVNGFGPDDEVVGFDVGASQTMADDIGPLITETSLLLDRPVTASWQLEASLPGLAYGEPSDDVFAAIRLVANTEALVLDPVYSGRAMAGLRQLLWQGWRTTSGPLVFVHTGGLPALFTSRYADRFADPKLIGHG